ncbi:hypothetical protein DFH09DRAFT_1109448 [Mycena vulgaris]|nr:hypothetical protein DFH09DRAFT_1109448 [Mycena vulgaris]
MAFRNSVLLGWAILFCKLGTCLLVPPPNSMGPGNRIVYWEGYIAHLERRLAKLEAFLDPHAVVIIRSPNLAINACATLAHLPGWNPGIQSVAQPAKEADFRNQDTFLGSYSEFKLCTAHPHTVPESDAVPLCLIRDGQMGHSGRPSCRLGCNYGPGLLDVLNERTISTVFFPSMLAHFCISDP